jgi:hypothetical protein
MRKFLTLSILLLAFAAAAQVPKAVVIEHFTNSLCGTCAFRNLGLFSNLAAHPEVLHLAIHPSSPYSQCLLNKHNTSENDARTNYYGIFGGTPRIVLQGNVVSPSVSFSTVSLFPNQAGQSSPFSVRMTLGAVDANDEFEVRVVVRTEAAHNYGTLQLFAAIAEDTLFYAAPNGENQHYNVFRKSVFETNGRTITPAAAVGDSVVLVQTMTMNSVWVAERVLGIAILQEGSSKAVVQAASSRSALVSATAARMAANFRLYAAGNRLFFEPETAADYEIQVFDLQGKAVQQFFVREKTEQIMDAPTGFYLVRVRGAGGSWSQLLPIVR